MGKATSRGAATLGTTRIALALAAALAGSGFLAGCVAVQDTDDGDLDGMPALVLRPTPAPTPSSPRVVDMAILDLREDPGPDPSLVRLSGTIVNHRKEDAVHVQVRIEARDAAGRVLTRVTTPVQADVIPPDGSASFEASLPRSGTIHDYHAEIVAR